MEGVIDSLLDQLYKLGQAVIPLSILILAGAVREWWVWGYVFRREVQEKEYWREKALASLGLAEKSLDTAEEAVEEVVEGMS